MVSRIELPAETPDRFVDLLEAVDVDAHARSAAIRASVCGLHQRQFEPIEENLAIGQARSGCRDGVVQQPLRARSSGR